MNYIHPTASTMFNRAEASLVIAGVSSPPLLPLYGSSFFTHTRKWQSLFRTTTFTAFPWPYPSFFVVLHRCVYIFRGFILFFFYFLIRHICCYLDACFLSNSVGLIYSDCFFLRLVHMLYHYVT